MKSDMIVGGIYRSGSGAKSQHLLGGHNLDVLPNLAADLLNVIGESLAGWVRNQFSGSRKELAGKPSANIS
jgi:hypothetical protein